MRAVKGGGASRLEGDAGVVDPRSSVSCFNIEKVIKCGMRKEAVNSLHQSVRTAVTETCFKAASSRESVIR